MRLKRDGTLAETRFRLSPKRTSPFKSAVASVQSTAGSRVVRISGSNAGYTTFRGRVRVLAIHSNRQFPLHFPSHASPCAIRFQTHSTRYPQKVSEIATKQVHQIFVSSTSLILKYIHPLPNKTHKATVKVLQISTIRVTSCAAIDIKRMTTRMGCTCSNFVVAFNVEIQFNMF